MFVTVEDEFGTANLVVYTDIGARDRAAMIGARLLVAEGRVERETEHAEVPITHLICRKLVDRSDLLNGLMRSEVARGWGDAALLRRRRGAAAGAWLGATEGKMPGEPRFSVRYFAACGVS